MATWGEERVGEGRGSPGRAPRRVPRWGEGVRSGFPHGPAGASRAASPAEGAGGAGGAGTSRSQTNASQGKAPREEVDERERESEKEVPVKRRGE